MRSSSTSPTARCTGADAPRPAREPIGFAKRAVTAQRDAQVVDRGSKLRMIPAKDLLFRGQGLAEQANRLRVAPLRVADRTEVAEICRDLIVLVAVRPPEDSNRTCDIPLGLGDAPALREDCAQHRHVGGNVGMSSPGRDLPNPDRPARITLCSREVSARVLDAGQIVVHRGDVGISRTDRSADDLEGAAIEPRGFRQAPGVAVHHAEIGEAPAQVDVILAQLTRDPHGASKQFLGVNVLRAQAGDPPEPTKRYHAQNDQIRSRLSWPDEREHPPVEPFSRSKLPVGFPDVCQAQELDCPVAQGEKSAGT